MRIEHALRCVGVVGGGECANRHVVSSLVFVSILGAFVMDFGNNENK